jgi:DNA-3-methyladenine glycosylase
MITLPLSFYERDTVTVAKELLGAFIVFGDEKIGRISETEAYVGLADKASHSSRGITPRTTVLFGPAGRWYVYMIYGMYYCLNVVTDAPESGGAVLIRAVEPIKGLEGKTSGPGLLCKAFGIDKRFNDTDVTVGPLTIQASTIPHTPLEHTLHTRVGIDYAGEDKDKLYRFRIAK